VPSPELEDRVKTTQAGANGFQEENVRTSASAEVMLGVYERAKSTHLNQCAASGIPRSKN